MSPRLVDRDILTIGGAQTVVDELIVEHFTRSTPPATGFAFDPVRRPQYATVVGMLQQSLADANAVTIRLNARERLLIRSVLGAVEDLYTTPAGESVLEAIGIRPSDAERSRIDELLTTITPPTATRVAALDVSPPLSVAAFLPGYERIAEIGTGLTTYDTEARYEAADVALTGADTTTDVVNAAIAVAEGMSSLNEYAPIERAALRDRGGGLSQRVLDAFVGTYAVGELDYERLTLARTRLVDADRRKRHRASELFATVAAWAGYRVDWDYTNTLS